jgi:hypothetical protein
MTIETAIILSHVLFFFGGGFAGWTARAALTDGGSNG